MCTLDSATSLLKIYLKEITRNKQSCYEDKGKDKHLSNNQTNKCTITTVVNPMMCAHDSKNDLVVEAKEE